MFIFFPNNDSPCFRLNFRTKTIFILCSKRKSEPVKTCFCCFMTLSSIMSHHNGVLHSNESVLYWDKTWRVSLCLIPCRLGRPDKVCETASLCVFITSYFLFWLWSTATAQTFLHRNLSEKLMRLSDDKAEKNRPPPLFFFLLLSGVSCRFLMENRWV